MRRGKRRRGRRTGFPEALITGATFATVYALWLADLSIMAFIVWAFVAIVVGGTSMGVAQAIAERHARPEGAQRPHGERS